MINGLALSVAWSGAAFLSAVTPEQAVPQEQQYCNADPCGRTPASLLCQRCRIGDADAVTAGGDGTAQEVLVRAVVCSVLAVDGDVESGVIGDSQHKPTVLFHLDVALHGVVAQIIMAQLPGAELFSRMVQCVILHGVHGALRDHIVSGGKFQFQLLDRLVRRDGVLEVVVLILIFPLRIGQLVADAVDGDCNVPGSRAVSQMIVHVEFQQEECVDRFLQRDRNRKVLLAVDVKLAVFQLGDLVIAA